MSDIKFVQGMIQDSFEKGGVGVLECLIRNITDMPPEVVTKENILVVLNTALDAFTGLQP